jgi:hypothetical protein
LALESDCDIVEDGPYDASVREHADDVVATRFMEITDEIRLEDYRVARPDELTQGIPIRCTEALGKEKPEGPANRSVSRIVRSEGRGSEGILRVWLSWMIGRGIGITTGTSVNRNILDSWHL